MRIVGLLCCLLFVVVAKGQLQATDTRTQLEEQRKDILQQITETEKELTLLRDNKKVTLNQLRVLQDKQSERERLIDNYKLEVNYINNKIELYSNQISGLKHKLEKYKLLYSKSIRFSYKSRNTYSLLAYICSSGDFNDAMRRMKYLKLMRTMRQQQADKIRATHAQLYHKIDLLNAEKASKDKILVELTGQNKTLAAETQETNNAVKDLTGREKELQTELMEKKKSAKRLNDAIQAIIVREMKNSEEKATENKDNREVPDKTKPKGEELPAITKTELALARNFEKNKGKLPCPVEKSNISCHFGKYNIKNIDYFNNGIDLQTITYGIVSAVYDGTVSSVVSMDGKLIIIVQHGNYFTVYSNLMKSLIIKGEHVAAKQPLGLVANNEDGYPTLNFQIWKSGGSKHETTVLNPETWIVRNRMEK